MNSIKKLLFISSIILFGVSVASFSKDTKTISVIGQNYVQSNSKRYATSSVNATQKAFSLSRNCIRGTGSCMVAINDDIFNNLEGTRPVSLSIAGSTKLLIENLNQIVNEDGNYLQFGNNYSLPSNICGQLGVSNITILAGTYTTDSTANIYGNTLVNAIIN